MVIAPQNVAYVKFTPSASNPHADFADEVYIPPVTLDSDFVPKLKNLDCKFINDSILVYYHMTHITCIESHINTVLGRCLGSKTIPDYILLISSHTK